MKRKRALNEVEEDENLLQKVSKAFKRIRRSVTTEEAENVQNVIVEEEKNNNNEIMTISVKFIDGKMLKFMMKPSNTIRTLKNQITKLTGILYMKQRLIFAGEILEDVQKLSDYFIQDGATLYFVLRLTAQLLPAFCFK
jgi:Ubiquitin family